MIVLPGQSAQIHWHMIDFRRSQLWLGKRYYPLASSTSQFTLCLPGQWPTSLPNHSAHEPRFFSTPDTSRKLPIMLLDDLPLLASYKYRENSITSLQENLAHAIFSHYRSEHLIPVARFFTIVPNTSYLFHASWKVHFAHLLSTSRIIFVIVWFCRLTFIPTPNGLLRQWRQHYFQTISHPSSHHVSLVCTHHFQPLIILPVVVQPVFPEITLRYHYPGCATGVFWYHSTLSLPGLTTSFSFLVHFFFLCTVCTSITLLHLKIQIPRAGYCFGDASINLHYR